MIKRNHLAALLFLFSLIAAAGEDAIRSIPAHANSTRVETADGAFINFAARDLHSLLADKKFTLINVHVPYEGEIEGTDANIPYNETGKIVKILPSDKAVMIVLYCRSGRMSSEAATELVKLGYTNVWNLEHGMIEWKEANLPIVIRKDQ